MPQDITVLLGTTKGVFLLDGARAADGWRVRGPFCDGWAINHVIGDAETGTIWAGGGGEFFGAGVWRSHDHGETWEKTRLTKGTMDDWAAGDPGFAKMIGWTDTALPFAEDFEQIWSLGHGHGTLYAGTKPAGLLKSTDGGASWERVEALTNHASAKDWNPGAAGLVLHTIVPHPDRPERMWIGISAAGVFATEDGGASWERRNRLSNAEACAGHNHPAAPANGEIGHCVHNMMRAPGDGDLLYQQNHHGVWRSSDGGRSWDDVTPGLPSTFGFPIRVHPRDAQTIWTLPLNGDSAGRFPPMRPARSGGRAMAAKPGQHSARACRKKPAFLRSCGRRWPVTRRIRRVCISVRIPGRSCQFRRREAWHEIARHLPTILGVEVLERG